MAGPFVRDQPLLESLPTTASTTMAPMTEAIQPAVESAPSAPSGGGTGDAEDGRHDPAKFLGARHDGAGDEADDQADNEHLDESHTSVPLK